MKKFKNAVALLVTLSMAAGVFTACESNDSKKKDKHKKDRDHEVEETTEATTEPEETTATTVEETEPTIEETEETVAPSDNNQFQVPYVDENNPTVKSFMLLNQVIDELNAEDPKGELRYSFSSGYYPEADCNWALLVGKEGEDEFDTLIVVNGEVYDEGMSSHYAYMPYDEIKKLPVFVEMYSPINTKEIHIDSEIDDGTYYGSLLAFSLDGTKALVVLSDYITITEEEYDALQPGDHISIADDDPEFTAWYDLTVSNEYDGETYTMFDSNCWFSKMENGDYILTTDSDCVVTYNDRYVFVDIAPDCLTYDTFVYLYQSYGEELPDLSVPQYVGGPNNFSNTFYFHEFTSDELDGSYNPNYPGWSEAYSILEPVIVEDNTITSIWLGWR